jgi:hypothetical protein
MTNAHLRQHQEVEVQGLDWRVHAQTARIYGGQQRHVTHELRLGGLPPVNLAELSAY